MPEQTLGGIPLGLGMVMKINFFEFSCVYQENKVIIVLVIDFHSGSPHDFNYGASDIIIQLICAERPRAVV